MGVVFSGSPQENKSEDKNRVIARHTDSLPFIDLLNCVRKLLYPKGKFCLILPLNEAYIFKEMAEIHGFYLTKLLRIKTKIDSHEEKRHLMQFEFEYKNLKESIFDSFYWENIAASLH